jgi:hypothetical protein
MHLLRWAYEVLFLGFLVLVMWVGVRNADDPDGKTRRKWIMRAIRCLLTVGTVWVFWATNHYILMVVQSLVVLTANASISKKKLEVTLMGTSKSGKTYAVPAKPAIVTPPHAASTTEETAQEKPKKPPVKRVSRKIKPLKVDF